MALLTFDHSMHSGNIPLSRVPNIQKVVASGTVVRLRSYSEPDHGNFREFASDELDAFVAWGLGTLLRREAQLGRDFDSSADQSPGCYVIPSDGMDAALLLQ